MHFMHCLAFVNRNYTHAAKDPTLDFDHAATTRKSASIPPQNTRLILSDAAKERLRIYRAKYYKANKETILAQNRKYQAKLKTGRKPKGKPGRPKRKPGRKPGRKSQTKTRKTVGNPVQDPRDLPRHSSGNTTGNTRGNTIKQTGQRSLLKIESENVEAKGKTKNKTL